MPHVRLEGKNIMGEGLVPGLQLVFSQGTMGSGCVFTTQNSPVSLWRVTRPLAHLLVEGAHDPPSHAHLCWDTAHVWGRNGSVGIGVRGMWGWSCGNCVVTGRRNPPENRGGGAGTMEATAHMAQAPEPACA